MKPTFVKIFPGFAHLVNRLDPICGKVIIAMCARMNTKNEIHLPKDLAELLIRGNVTESDVYAAIEVLRDYPQINENEVIGDTYAGPLVQMVGDKFIVNPCFAHKNGGYDRGELIVNYFQMYEDNNM